MLVQVCVQSLGLDRSSNAPVLILKELKGQRALPIWIGPGEASAIAMELAQMKFSRPLTHDLFVSMIGGLGGTLQKVIISRVKESTYFAEMIIRKNGEIVSIDARPSDSIAVALRMNAEILAHEELLGSTSIEVSEGSSVLEYDGSSSKLEMGSDSAAEDLKEYLRNLAPEDFGRFNP